jgi:hypothetical protein
MLVEFYLYGIMFKTSNPFWSLVDLITRLSLNIYKHINTRKYYSSISKNKLLLIYFSTDTLKACVKVAFIVFGTMFEY